MRRHLPAFSHFFNIHPWDIGRLTRAELDEYATAMGEMPPYGGVILAEEVTWRRTK